MHNKECIIMFTKDRPETLSKTLSQVVNTKMPVIVLDDSTTPDTKQIVENTKKNDKNTHYHGKIEQQKHLQDLKKMGFDYSFFIKPLGTYRWTLGYTRNYAIILAKSLGFERVLFMDDDIIIKDLNIIQETIRLLDNADFVGAKIGGMPDYSVVDHIKNALEMQIYDFLSAGFLAFNLKSVSEYFLNYYNEDWIWLFLHKPKAKLVKYGEVYQLPYDPFGSAINKALQQEFGEILVEGVKEAVESRNSVVLTDKHFWGTIIKKRTNLIKALISLSKNSYDICVSVGKSLLTYIYKVDVKDFVNIFITFYARKKLWNHLLCDLSEYKSSRFLWGDA